MSWKTLHKVNTVNLQRAKINHANRFATENIHRDFILLFFAQFTFTIANLSHSYPSNLFFKIWIPGNRDRPFLLESSPSPHWFSDPLWVGLFRNSWKKMHDRPGLSSSACLSLSFPLSLLFGLFCWWGSFKGLATHFSIPARLHSLPISARVLTVADPQLLSFWPWISRWLWDFSRNVPDKRFQFHDFSFWSAQSYLLFFFITSQMARREASHRRLLPLRAIFLSAGKPFPVHHEFLFLFYVGGLTTFFPLYAINRGFPIRGSSLRRLPSRLYRVVFWAERCWIVIIAKKLILPCLFILIFSMVILAFSKILFMFILAAFIWGVGHAFLYPSLVVYMLDRVGSSRGPAMATLTALSDLGVCMGSIIMGIIIPLTGYPIMFLCLAFIGVLNLFYFYFIVGKKWFLNHSRPMQTFKKNPSGQECF